MSRGQWANVAAAKQAGWPAGTNWAAGRRLVNSAAGAPVEAGRAPGHERLVDQVPAQRAVVVEDRLEDLVDRGFWILAAGLKCLSHLVKQQTTAGALSRHRENSAVADERPQHLWRVGEETVSVMTHLKPSMTRAR
jgi:hypothetical protein